MSWNEPIAKSGDDKYRLSLAEWNERTRHGTSDFCGRWMAYGGELPELEGRRTAFESLFTCEPGTALLIEGLHFVVEEG